MRKTLFSVSLPALLLGAAGLANAAEPLALTDHQMDAVSAGWSVSSTVGATAYALWGAAGSGSQTHAIVAGPVAVTGASAQGVSIGIGAFANSGALSIFVP